MRATNGSRKIRSELAALAGLADADIDASDIPEVNDWRGAQRGRFYRPIKQLVTIRLDADVVAWFKSRDRKYQTAVNRALREYMLGHRAAPPAKRSSVATPASRKQARR